MVDKDIINNFNVWENDLERLEKIIKILGFDKVYLYEEKKDKKVFLYLNEKTANVEQKNIYHIIKKLYKNTEIKKFLTNMDYSNFNDLYQDIIEYFTDNKLVENIVYKLDFTQKEKIKIRYFEQNLEVSLNYINFKIDTDFKIDKQKYKKYYKHYLKVFPHFKELLDIMAYNLFDEGRKTSFVYLNAPSNWGKSFLIDIFKEIGIGFETQLNKLTKIPSPLTPEHFRNKILFSIDEFTVFKNELKTLTNKLHLEPKNKSQVEVQIFTKLFTSAEMSMSFDEVADDQIINRMIFFDYDTNKTLLIEDLKQYDINLNELHKYLQCFTYRYLNKKINYIKTNNINVEPLLDKIVENRKIQVQNVEEKLKEIIIDLFESYTINDNEYNEYNLWNSRVYFDKENQKLYITNFVKFLEEYVKSITDEQTFKKLRYKFKRKTLFKIFNIEENKITINRKQDRFYIIDIKRLYDTKKSDTNLDIKEQKIIELQAELNKAEKEKKFIDNKLFEIIAKITDIPELYTNEDLQNKTIQEKLEIIETEINELKKIIREEDKEEAETEEKINEDCPF